MEKHRHTKVCSPLIAALISLLTAVTGHTAGRDNEAYFSQDLDDAIAAAKRSPADQKYVGATWYNRSTSRSFALPKMLNTEMDTQVIEGAMGPTAAGEAAAAEAQRPVLDAALGRLKRALNHAERNAGNDLNALFAEFDRDGDGELVRVVILTIITNTTTESYY